MYNGGYVDSRFNAGGSIANGFQYNENYGVKGMPSGTVTSTPDGFGLEAVHQGNAADLDFEVGTDGSVRYGPTAPAGYSEGSPVGQK